MRWSYATASVRGTSHVRAGTRLQDAKRCFVVGDTSLLVVVADGAGSATFGGEGAAIVCRTIATSAHSLLATSPDIPTDDMVWSWVDECRDRISVSAAKRDSSPRQFATTMVLVLATKAGVLTAHVGDGAAVGRHCDDRQWSVLSRPAHGEYASTTFFITDDPEPQLRISRYQPDYDAIAVFSDGIENLVIDHRTGEASPSFFDPMARPLDNSPVIGRDFGLSRNLAAFLDSARVNDLTDDDKTLVIAARK
ncbi:PP2C family serine/threonine-protein phosphatase [Mesorhizobium sp. VK25A]|uniref:PP2C family serine/threonine-protein phosphatase n=1 Tax=Mesorhizobium vachelliae TaxID=3072309 RepID=A0ABU5A528_9HYPH|nr:MULTISPECIES: PP2C family serine/threonine-protein phosphatase [unclassified Mesorhizobium]MDX8532784.1 PP2C family serine/threonine-protein phosphatase [Mesorhizobium sp. VK25D]MDX8544710.1 PP2C family serine/threonine-protein phosphatase [Mesorhizobium sp. VK25A]